MVRNIVTSVCVGISVSELNLTGKTWDYNLQKTMLLLLDVICYIVATSFL